MACMCGDIQCSSCGPAQGNYRCPLCRAWADDGCEHINEETGEIKPEYQQAAEETTKESDFEDYLSTALDKLADNYFLKRDKD